MELSDSYLCLLMGEFTPTLEDVYNIMRLPITGDADPFDITLDEDSEMRLEILREGACGSPRKYEFSNWVRYFWGSTKGDLFENGAGFYSGCRLEAMLAYWLSKYMFADYCGASVQQRVLPLAVVLATGACLPLASLFLGRFYRMLDLISNDEREGTGCFGVTSSTCSIFLQVFIWERFKGLAVKPVTREFLRKFQGGRESRSVVDFPLCCRWFRRKIKKDAFEPAIFDDVNKFIFRPYSSILGFQVFPFYYPEDQSWAPPSRLAMSLTTTSHHLPAYGDRFEPIVVRYSPHRVRGQFGINQGVPVGGFACRTAKAVIVGFIKHVEDSGKSMFSNCLGIKNSVGIRTVEYKKFWELQLRKFNKFIGTEGATLRRPDSPNKNKRLIPSKSLMGRMSRLNLPYVEVYSNGAEHVVGRLGKIASRDDFDVTTTRVKSENNSGSRESITTSKYGKEKDNGKVHPFRTKISKDHTSYTSARGVRMVLPTDALPFGKGMKRKVISNPETSQTLAKRKATLGDLMVGREQSLSDDSYNRCERGGSSVSDGSSNGSERGDSSAYEEEFCEGNYEDTQDVSAREVRCYDAGVGAELEIPVHDAELEILVRDAERQMPVRGAERQMPVRGAERQMPARGAERQVPVRGAEPQMPVRGAEPQMPVCGAEPNMPVRDAEIEYMETSLPAKLPHDRHSSFAYGFASFCGKPGGFDLLSAVTPKEVDNSNTEDSWSIEE